MGEFFIIIALWVLAIIFTFIFFDPDEIKKDWGKLFNPVVWFFIIGGLVSLYFNPLASIVGFFIAVGIVIAFIKS